MNTTTLTLSNGGYLARRSVADWLFAVAVVIGAGYAFAKYGARMDVYETWILAGAVPSTIALGWFWSPLRPLAGIVAFASLLAIGMYAQVPDSFGADLAAGEDRFLLKYLLSSQSAVLWSCMLFFLSTLFYWLGFFSKQTDGNNAAQRIGSGMAWGAVALALIGTMVRWYESHQIAPDIGHIPVSNLYEVFIMFCWMTTLYYLYYEQQYKTRAMGAFVMPIVSAGVAFLLWYSVTRDAHEIQPLVPALQSWWMKLHVPANFVGYGTFALSAMVALAVLLKSATPRALWTGLVILPVLFVVAPLIVAVGFASADIASASAKSLRMVVPVLVVCAIAIAARRFINPRTPEVVVMDDVMYRAIAVGFAFFTIATILGAFWAAEAWGGYWSWDPKETWALIVWLNYAAWLHMRLIKGLRGTVASWWALVGLFITTFAFLGVNMFLSGLHSYGEL